MTTSTHYLHHDRVAMPALEVLIVFSAAIAIMLTQFLSPWWVVPITWVFFVMSSVWHREPLSWSKDWLALSNGLLPLTICGVSAFLIGYATALAVDQLVLSSNLMFGMVLLIGLSALFWGVFSLLYRAGKVMGVWRRQQVTQSDRGGYTFVLSNDLDPHFNRMLSQNEMRKRIIATLVGTAVIVIVTVLSLGEGLMDPWTAFGIWGRLELPLMWGVTLWGLALFLASKQSEVIGKVVLLRQKAEG